MQLVSGGLKILKSFFVRGTLASRRKYPGIDKIRKDSVQVVFVFIFPFDLLTDLIQLKAIVKILQIQISAGI